MAVRPIRMYGDPVLREKCRPVEEITPEIHTLVEDLFDTMIDASGIGLAAPQVGETIRVFVIDLSATDEGCEPMAFINPEILSEEGERNDDEGCLSFPDYFDKVARAERVIATAIGLDQKPFEVEGTGIMARALLHENDHLNGVLFIDRMKKFRLRLAQGRLRKLKRSTEEALKEEG